MGNGAIADLWRNKFSQVLNSIEDQNSMNELLVKISLMPNAPVLGISVDEIQSIVKNLANNKAAGLDFIPNEFYKSAPQNILILISIIFNSLLNHSFLPNTIMNVLIVPLFKGKLKDPSNSSNYRPIAIATAPSKIFEMLFLI